MHKGRIIGMGLLFVALFGLRAFAHGPLTFRQRVEAQTAIERVYYNHRIWPKANPGPKPPFAQMVPEAVIAAKVRNYLKESAALEEYWHRPITAKQLQAEMDRMAKQTRDPAMLKELFHALNDDPDLIAECLARPALADREIRDWYANDRRFHGKLRDRIVLELRGCSGPQAMAQLSGKFSDVVYVKSGKSQNAMLPENKSIKLDLAEWNELTAHIRNELGSRSIGPVSLHALTGKLSGLQETRAAYFVESIVSTGPSEIRVRRVTWRKRPFYAWWKGIRGNVPAQGFEDCAEGPSGALGSYQLSNIREGSGCDDSWMSDGFPSERENHTAVWTGTEMIVWGGCTYSLIQFGTGGRYNPATDTWSSMSEISGPAPRYSQTAVWTGTKMIVWGGISYATGIAAYLNTGGVYDPVSDTWSATSTGTGCPSGRYLHTAVWTGSKMIVWGGNAYAAGSTKYLNSGGVYDPSADEWVATSTSGAPSGRYGHTAVWTGTEMIVWGGIDSNYLTLDTGGRYNPSTDTWLSTNTDGAPGARYYHTAVWAGSEMIVWGGNGTSDLDTGALYDPSTDTWTAMSAVNAPPGRRFHTAVWTGSTMIVWGGVSGSASSPHYLNSGGIYDPASDTWTATQTGGECPSGRCFHTAVWTGTEMIIWGGENGTYLDSGGRYDPLVDSWVATSTDGAPAPSEWGSAVWTGSEMIVWGGEDESSSLELNSGGLYDPALDQWQSMTLAGAPEARRDHTAVWTGTQMVIWGGQDYDLGWVPLNTGGRYDPATDSWTGVSNTNAPQARSGHAAVWTGTMMLVWGGSGLNTGGAYDPHSDAWSPISTSGAPEARSGCSAVWTGREMIIWGGYDGSSYLQTGRRYDPSNDQWFPVSTTGAPSARENHTAVWTGTRMIVWGGEGGGDSNTGALYDPVDDKWQEMSTDGAPYPRSDHTAVWTGEEMIVWGGLYNTVSTHICFESGGRYNPCSDTWKATSLAGAPAPRYCSNAVWTGTQMLIWGGSSWTTDIGRYCASVSGPGSPLSAPEVLSVDGQACDGTIRVTSGSPTLAWSDVPNETGFDWEVLEGTDCLGTVVASGTTAAGVISVAVDPPLAGGTYTWQVRALGGGTTYCDSGWTCGCTFTAPCSTLASPTLVTVDGQACGGAITTSAQTPALVWSDVANESGFEWQVLSGVGCAGAVAAGGTTTAGVTSATVSAVLPGGTYTWQVRALGDGAAYCDGDWTCGCTFTVGCVPLTAPSQRYVNGLACGGSITTSAMRPSLTWSDVVGETGYAWEIWSGTNCTGTLIDSGTVGVNTTFARPSANLPDGTYYWRVKALGDAVTFCDSAWTCGCTFTIQCTEVDAPTQLSVDGYTCGGTIAADTPVLSWSNVQYNGGYAWEVWTGEGCTGTRVASGTTGTDGTTATPSIPAGTYHWRVMGLGDGISRCDGPWTCGCSFTLSTQQLPAPVQLTVDGQACGAYIPANSDSPVLAWRDLNGETQYEWQVWTGVLCTGSLVASGTTAADTTAVQVSPVLATGTYHWRIRGIGDGTGWTDSPWTCGCPFTVGSPSCDATELYDPEISADTTWDLSGSPYVVHGTLTVDSGVSLTVDAGAIVKFDSGASAIINGTLNANGTATDLVVFGSINDPGLCGPTPGGTPPPSAGSWNGISFPAGSSASISDSLVRDATTGLAVSTTNQFTASNVTVEDCNTGVETGGNSSPAFTNLNCTRAPLQIDGNSTPSFTGGVWDGGGAYGISGWVIYGYSSPTDTPDPSFSGVTIQNMDPSGHGAMQIEAYQAITGMTHWSGIPFALSGTTTIAPGGVVSVSDATVYVSKGSGIGLTVDGTLDIGSAGTTTVFQSAATTPAPGDWQGITYEAGSNGGVTNATIEHASTGLGVFTSNPFTVDRSTFVFDYTGLQSAGTSMPKIQRSTFTNDSVAVLVTDSALPDLGAGQQESAGYNTLIGSSMSLDNESAGAVSAQTNWWGCPTTLEMDDGVQNISLIHDQQDDPTKGAVDYSNWLGESNRRISASADTAGGARDVVLSWPQEPTGALTVYRGTDPQNLTQVGSTAGASWRDTGALDGPSLIFYKVEGPCS